MLGRAESIAGLLRQQVDDRADVLRLGIETGAHRRGPDVLLRETLGRLEHPGVCPADGQRVRRELLAQPDGHRVLHVRAPRLEHTVEGDGTLRERVGQLGDRRRAPRRVRSRVATRIAVGKVSLVDCAMLTWSLGLTTA